jgi:hypothetical protein
VGGTLDPNPFVAYFCPFKEKETHGTVISSAANLMFTTQMDGCSLGIGSPTTTGDRLIFHANAGGQPSVATNTQDASLRANFSAGNTLIQQIWGPADYRESRKGTFYKATTFGVRTPTTNTWSFYSQRYTTETSSHSISTILSLKEVATVLA